MNSGRPRKVYDEKRNTHASQEGRQNCRDNADAKKGGK